MDCLNTDSTDPKAMVSISFVKVSVKWLGGYVQKWELKCVLRPTGLLEPSWEYLYCMSYTPQADRVQTAIKYTGWHAKHVQN